MSETTVLRASRRTWAGLALLTLPMVMLSTDLTVLFFAMPAISTDLSPGPTQALWIVHVYGFLIAGLLISMGRLGDRIGPRKLLLVGAAAFGVLAVLAAFSTSATMLVVIRALLGIAGATLMPSLFSLLRVMFTDEKQRRLAIAIMMSAFSVGGAAGPLLGGVLLEFFWWGSVFLVNVPFMVLLVAVGPWLLPERSDLESARLDVASVLLSVAGMLAVVYGLQEIAADTDSGAGTAWLHLAIMAAGAGLLAWFVRRQGRLRDPLFDLSLLRDRRIAAPLTSVLLVGIGLVGTYYLLTQFLQGVAGLSALHAAYWTLPYVAANIAGFLAAPALAGRIRPAIIATGGTAIGALGLGLTAVATSASSSIPSIMGLFAVAAVGQGMAFALLSDMIISSAPAERAGSAAAAQEVSGELGTAAGIAIGGAIGLLVYRTQLARTMPDGVPDSERESALNGIHTVPSEGADDLLRAAQDAFAAGVATFAWVAAALMAVSAIFLGWTLVRAPRQPAPVRRR
ncbi:MFS transporter [Bogoriella caseilytica]|uniref:DHA2 family multidrug resistance protein-like MFS transporter n=1 Tax=Bogoriella caseilytica TaxID=56055 RepID=A0A3N2BE56_9MICO|nr:MFS transporter [Bogoriella caseilytica]ROR73324.1 DHA2 family multidrug resistance protein-like MFS transporter [Bogoriella caseilytica]